MSSVPSVHEFVMMFATWLSIVAAHASSSPDEQSAPPT